MKIINYELRKDGVYDTDKDTLVYSLGDRGSLMHGLPNKANFGLRSNEYSLFTSIRNSIRQKHEQEFGESFATYMRSQKNLHTRWRLRSDLKRYKKDMPPSMRRATLKQLKEASEEVSPEHRKILARHHGAASVAKKFTNKAVKILVSEADPDCLKIARRYDVGSRGLVYKYSLKNIRTRQMFETFPVLALLAYRKESISNNPIHDMIVDGERMKRMCSVLGLNKVFRKIMPQNAFLVSENLAKFQALHDRNRELFTDYMPTKTMEQYRWLKVIVNAGFAYQVIDDDALAFSAWLGKALSTECKKHLRNLESFAGFMRDAYLELRWPDNVTWDSATDRQAKWHRMESERREEERQLRRKAEEEKPFPVQWISDYEDDKGYSISYIDTPEGLREEGDKMHHCVGSYSSNVHKGYSSIYSVRKDGKRVATLELRKSNAVQEPSTLAFFCEPKESYRIGQLYGHCNKAVSSEVRDIANAWVRGDEEA